MPRALKKTIKFNPLENLTTKMAPAKKGLEEVKATVTKKAPPTPSPAKKKVVKKQLNYQKLIIGEDVKMQPNQPQASEILEAEVNDGHHPEAKHFRNKMAEQNVKNWAQWSVAAGFIPFPFVDTAAISAVQIKMIYDLCKIYDVPFKKEAAMTIVAGVLGGGATTIVSQKVGMVFLSKVPYVGTVLAELTQPGISYATTYGIGMAFVKHFETNGNLINFEIAAANKAFKEYYDQAKSFSGKQIGNVKKFSCTQFDKAKKVFSKSKDDAENVIDEATA